MNTVKNKLDLQPEIFYNLLAVLFYELLESTENWNVILLFNIHVVYFTL